MLIFQFLVIFLQVRIFQLLRIKIFITMWKRSLFSKYLDKIKIANTTNIKFLFTACKASSYLIKLITFTCTNLSPKKACEETKENKEVVSNWSHLNLCRHNFDFHLSKTVATVDLFVVVFFAAAVVVPVVVAVGKDMQV